MNLNPIMKIVIADDHQFVRTSFTSILQSNYPQELEFVAEASNGSSLVEAVQQYRPHLVITDIQMPTLNGIEACKIIRKQYPDTAVMAFSMFTDTNNILGMLQAGATGYVAKTSNVEEIIEGIRLVGRQQSYYCSSISNKLYGIIGNSIQRNSVIKKPVFGKQEIIVMRLICKQYSTKEIAIAMQLSTKTVEHYRQNIQEKIGARNVVGVAVYALVNELVKHDEIS